MSHRNMDSSLREQLCNQFEECTGTFLIHSDHSRLQALSSIRSLREIPQSVLSLITELASDAFDDSDRACCLSCDQRVHVPIEQMKDKRGFTTWFRVEEEWEVAKRLLSPDYRVPEGLICEKCILEEEWDVCLDCNTGAFCELQFFCEGCNEGCVCEECFHENQDLYKSGSMTLEDRDKYLMIACLKCMDAIVGKVTKQNVQKLTSRIGTHWNLSERQKRNRAKIFSNIAVNSNDSTTRKAESTQKKIALEKTQLLPGNLEDVGKDAECKISTKVTARGTIRRSKRLQGKQSVEVHVPTKRARHK